MAIEVTVKHRDGTTTDAKVWASTEVAFESQFGKAWGEAFSEDHPKQTYLYFAAYHAIQEAGRTGLTFEDWIKTVDAITLAGVESAPLDQAPPPGSSES